ncbi:hypothetical protein OJAG_35210 [Oerskovia enterophila]|uniref:Uncharacterized protein n=1 Tax=Oerskovia enterophila TaxID=43678 RepID=A0A163Q049_9CELL|nr:hypothetical protein OJAG_35210 [Oerskovia enterophila]
MTEVVALRRELVFESGNNRILSIDDAAIPEGPTRWF